MLVNNGNASTNHSYIQILTNKLQTLFYYGTILNPMESSQFANPPTVAVSFNYQIDPQTLLTQPERTFK